MAFVSQAWYRDKQGNPTPYTHKWGFKRCPCCKLWVLALNGKHRLLPRLYFRKPWTWEYY